MINMHNKTVSTALFLIAAMSLSACSGISKLRGALSDDGSVDYQNNQAIKKLEVPPDLTQPEFDKSFELPTGIISAVSLKNGTAMPRVNSADSSNNVPTVSRGDLSSIKTVAGRTVLQVNDTYPRSLVLTEIMLTRMGFSTVSKSSVGDSIVAKYTGASVSASDVKSTGFLSKFKNIVTLGGEGRKLNSNQALANGKTYRVTIKNEQGSPIVRIAPISGEQLSDAANTKVITLLNTAFNK